MDDNEYGYIKKKVLDLTKIDLDSYKEQQMRRRLTGLMERAGAEDASSYFGRIEKDRRMLDELRDFLTINVSEFFRDKQQFERLQSIVLPEALQNNPRLNIWSAGCSNGSEPYTLAIILAEISPGRQHRILATDIDTTILGRAKAGGPYTAADVKNVSRNLLAKHFKESEGNYWVIDSIREKVEFRQHNLLSDPYEDNLDLIICRNVVIYFTNEAKNKINQRFCQSLKDQGVLFIGGSEIIFEAPAMRLESFLPSFYRKSLTGVPARQSVRAAETPSRDRWAGRE